jgi:hypothetical protein
MIMTVDDYYEYGNIFGIDQASTEKTNPNFTHCNHTKSKTQNYAMKNTNYIQSDSSHTSKSGSDGDNKDKDESIW